MTIRKALALVLAAALSLSLAACGGKTGNGDSTGGSGSSSGKSIEFWSIFAGGSTPFTFDVTQVLTEGENIIAVRVQDDCFDLELPRGKQYWKSTSEGIFYTPSTGIWQTV